MGFVPIKSGEQLDTQWLELLLDQSRFDRSGSFQPIEEAIAHHDSEFPIM